MSRIINGVFGLAFDKSGKILLSQRYDPDEPKAHLKWQIPGGGQEFGEHLEKTLSRELKEELGIENLTVLDHRPVFSYSIWGEKENAVHVNLFVYAISIGDCVPFINDGETADWKWFSLQDARELDTLPNVQETISQLAGLVSQTG